MIRIWLAHAIEFLRWLFLAPASRDVLRINANAPCPACGARRGSIRTVEQGDGRLICRHTCRTCRARWHEKTIVAVTIETVWPAFPQGDAELREDMQAIELSARSRQFQEVSARLEMQRKAAEDNARPWKVGGKA